MGQKVKKYHIHSLSARHCMCIFMQKESFFLTGAASSLQHSRHGSMSEVDVYGFMQDSEELMDQYALLRSQTEQHLIDIQCKVKRLLVCVMDVRHMKLLSEKSLVVNLKNASTVSDVFLELVMNGLMSFLQFSILRRIITLLCRGSEELQEELKAYEKRFYSYIGKRICETHVYFKGSFETFTVSEAKKKVELLIITDENWDYNTQFLRVIDLKAIVAKCLHISNFALEIVSVEPHCLRLRCAIFIHTARSVFPLTDEEWKKLSHHGIVKMQCLEYFYSAEDKGTS